MIRCRENLRPCSRRACTSQLSWLAVTQPQCEGRWVADEESGGGIKAGGAADFTVGAQDRGGGGADDDRKQSLAGQGRERELSHTIGQRNLDTALLGSLNRLANIMREIDQVIAR